MRLSWPHPSLDRTYLYAVQLGSSVSPWSPSTTFERSDLRPGTQYVVHVDVVANKSTNERGHWCDVRRSGPFSFTTDEAAPSGAPQNVTVSAVSWDQAVVVWEAPAVEQRNGVIVQYSVVLLNDSGAGAEAMRNITVDGMQLSVQLGNLTERTVYWVQVQAWTKVGAGPLSTRVIFETPAMPTTTASPTSAASSSGSQAVGVAVGVTAGVLLLAVVLLVVYLRGRRRQKASIAPELDHFEPFMETNCMLLVDPRQPH